MEVVSWGLGAVLLVLAVIVSVRARRIHPTLLLALGVFSIFWIESPYDWVLYASFHPDLARFPSWGVFGMTWYGLVWIAPIGYIMYFATPALIATGIVNRLGGRVRSRPVALLAVGLTLGFVYELAFELTQIAAGVVRYAHAVLPLVLFSDTRYQFPIYVSVMMGTLIMFATYLVGSRDDRGNDFLQAWAARRTTSARNQSLLAVGGAVVLCNAVYLAVMFPAWVAKEFGWASVDAGERSFDVRPNQPLGTEPASMSESIAGFAFIVVCLIVVIAAIFWLVRRFDPIAKLDRAHRADARETQPAR